MSTRIGREIWIVTNNSAGCFYLLLCAMNFICFSPWSNQGVYILFFLSTRWWISKSSCNRRNRHWLRRKKRWSMYNFMCLCSHPKGIFCHWTHNQLICNCLHLQELTWGFSGWEWTLQCICLWILPYQFGEQERTGG